MSVLKSKHTRVIIQITILIIVIISAINHQLMELYKSIPWVSESLFHYICPTCGVTSIYQFLTSSTLWVEKVKSTLGMMIGISIMLAIVFGPVLCGFICPFGTIQDLVAKIGKKLFKGKYNKFIPSTLDNKLKYIRYVMLIVTVMSLTFIIRR